MLNFDDDDIVRLADRFNQQCEAELAEFGCPNGIGTESRVRLASEALQIVVGLLNKREHRDELARSVEANAVEKLVKSFPKRIRPSKGKKRDDEPDPLFFIHELEILLRFARQQLQMAERLDTVPPAERYVHDRRSVRGKTVAARGGGKPP